MNRTLDASLTAVEAFAPSYMLSHFFKWQGDSTVLERKTFTIAMVHSSSSLLDHSRKVAGGFHPDLDAFTQANVNKKDNTMGVVLVILADKIFYDDNGFERKDAFARLVLALAHEIYGNVQMYLEKPLDGSLKPETREDRVANEISAFSASIRFLENLSTNQIFQSLPDKIKDDFKRLLVSEREGLRSWKSLQEGSSNRCDVLNGQNAQKRKLNRKWRR